MNYNLLPEAGTYYAFLVELLYDLSWISNNGFGNDNLTAGHLVLDNKLRDELFKHSQGIVAVSELFEQINGLYGVSLGVGCHYHFVYVVPVVHDCIRKGY